MWIELKRICKRDCVYIFFCTTKFGYKLIQSNERWFKYDLVWEKSRKVGFLSANKMPLRKHEMVYVFADDGNIDLENNRNLGLREYFKSVIQFTNKTRKEIINECGRCAEHCFYINSTQFGLPTEKTYNKLIEKYKINDMPGFRDYESLTNEWGHLTYNPQKTEGNPYAVKAHMLNQDSIYGSKFIPEHSNITGDRHPHSILQFPNDFEYQNNSDHEMVYLFKEKQGTYNPQKTAGKPYKIQEGNITDGHVYDKNKKRGSINNKGDRHPTSILQFPNDFEYQNNSSHEMVYLFKEKQGTYNPQKTEGEPYNKGFKSNIGCYGETGESKTYFAENKTGDRYPTTILKFNNPKKSLHRTQKPTDLCEWLIKTYSNEGDNVLDFTMGSGTTGVACINTNRNFIGVEMDKEIFKVARHRLFKHELEKFKSTVYT